MSLANHTPRGRQRRKRTEHARKAHRASDTTPRSARSANAHWIRDRPQRLGGSARRDPSNRGIGRDPHIHYTHLCGAPALRGQSQSLWRAVAAARRAHGWRTSRSRCASGTWARTTCARPSFVRTACARGSQAGGWLLPHRLASRGLALADAGKKLAGGCVQGLRLRAQGSPLAQRKVVGMRAPDGPVEQAADGTPRVRLTKFVGDVGARGARCRA